MRILKKKLPRDFNLYLFGDDQEGNSLKATDKYLECIERIHDDPIGVAIHHGDTIESIMIDDSRYDHVCVRPGSENPILQAENEVKQLQPIKHKLIAVLEGNHEWRLYSRFGNTVRKLICESLTDGYPDKIYGSYSARISFYDKEKQLMFKQYAFHGAGSINSICADPMDRQNSFKKSLRRKLERKASDCAIMSMGHTHKLIVVPPVKELLLRDDGKQLRHGYTFANGYDLHIPPSLRWYVNTGSFLLLADPKGRGLSGYAERAGYDPLELGYAIVKVREGLIETIDKVII